MSTNKGEAAVDTLRRAAAKIREAAETAYPGPWLVVRCDGKGRGGIEAHEPHVEIREDDGDPAFAGCAPLIADLGPTLGHLDDSGPHIALWDPVTALCVADWLDAEATLLDLMEPLVDLWNAVLKQDGSPVGEFKLGRQEDGEIAMHVESTPAALALAHRILWSAS